MNVVLSFAEDVRLHFDGACALGSGRMIGQAFEQHGRPGIIRSDSGREFIAASLLEWFRDQMSVTPVQVEKAPAGLEWPCVEGVLRSRVACAI